MNAEKLQRLQDRVPSSISFRSSVQLCDASLDVSTMYSGGLQLGKLKPDKFKAYVEFRLAHAFPVVSSYNTSFHPSTLRNSFESMLHQQFNYGHLIREYYKGKPEENKIREDRILGSIVAVDFPREPMGGWSLTNVEDAPGMHCVATLAKQAKGMDRLLGGYQSGRQDWTVSLEVDYQLVESGVVVVPQYNEKDSQTGGNKDLGGASRENAISEDDMSILAKHTPPDYQKAGLWYLPLIEANDDIIDCFSVEKGMFVKPWKGNKLVMLMGGYDGVVDFKGTGVVNYGAEPTARIESILAEDKEMSALSENVTKLTNVLDKWFSE